VLVPETIPKPAEGRAGFRYMARFVTLVWIPSHQGIKGNETADQAAQQQQKSINSLIWLRKPGTEGDESRYAMHRLLEKKWQNIWTYSTHGQFYRKIEPKVSSQIKYSHPSPQQSERSNNVQITLR